MTSSLPFCKIKLQFIDLMTKDPELCGNSLRVGITLATRFADYQSGSSYPSFKKIAEHLGISTKTVKRAINVLEAQSYFTVKRGSSPGKSSRYTPTEVKWRLAEQQYRAKNKSSAKKIGKGGQSGPKWGTGQSGNGGQACPPTSEKEEKIKTWSATAQTLAGYENLGDQILFFVRRGMPFIQTWNARLDDHGMQPVERLLPLSDYQGERGYWLPAKQPAAINSPEWRMQKITLERVIEVSHQKTERGVDE